MSLEYMQYKSVMRFFSMKDKSRDEVIVELKSVYAYMRVHQGKQFTGGFIISKCRTFVFVGNSPERPIEIDEKITESLKEIVKNARKITNRDLTSRINVRLG